MSLPFENKVGAHRVGPISFGTFRLDRERRVLLKDGEPVRIGSRALDLLSVLIDRAGDVVGTHELLNLVWQGVVVDEATVRMHISLLRRLLGDGRGEVRFIVNIAGRGYSFVAPVTREVEPHAQSGFQNFQPAGRAPSLPRLLIGRDRVVGSLSELLLARRFISIVGSGGIGKTTVAAAIVQNLRSEFGDGEVVFVDFGAVLEGNLVAQAVISAVGCTMDGADPITELLTFLADKRMLIVFDGCEHLVDPTSLLAEQIFRNAPGAHLLVTSREALRVEGEIVHLLGPLAYPADERPTAAEALATPAVQLFMARAAAGGFHEELKDTEAAVVSEICRRTDGIALAIELAASRVGTYGIRGVASLLASNMELSLAGRRNVVPRHRTLEAMLEWSFNLLTDGERRILCRLSIFVGPFTLEAACSVAGDAEYHRDVVAAVLTDLVDKSLVWVHPSGDAIFYRLPDTTRTYAATKLDELDDAEPIDRRHACYFAALFKSIALENRTYATIGQHAPHVANVRKALEWSFSHDEHRLMGADLAADAAPLFLGLCLHAECRHWSRLALDLTQMMGDTPEREVRLLEALALSSMHTRGNSQEVRAALERGLHLSDSGGHEFPQLHLIAGLQLFLTRIGDFEGALAAAKRCLAIATHSGSRRYQAIAEWMVGLGYHRVGNQVAALHHHELGFQLEADIAGLKADIFGFNHHLRALIGLSRTHWLRGSPQKGCEFAYQAIEEAARADHPTNYCIGMLYSLPVLLWSGDVAKVYEYIERGLAHAERYSFFPYVGTALALKGEWLVMTGEPLLGVDTLRQALKILHREKHGIVIPTASRALAEGLALCERHEEAQAIMNTTLSSVIEAGQKFYLPDLLRAQGEIFLKGPDPDTKAAESSLLKSISHAKDQGALGWELKAAVPLAQLLIKNGRSIEARALIEPILDGFVEKSGSSDLVDAADILSSLK